MDKHRFPLTALTISALLAAGSLAGCAKDSSSAASQPSPSASATNLAASASASAPPAASSTIPSPAASQIAAASPPTGSGQPLVPATATSATLTYASATGAGKPLHVTKDVTGATYQRLVVDLNSLQPVTGLAQCNVLTGETATITVTTGGHTTVITVPGSPCRGVSVVEDGAPMRHFASSMTLLNQVRAIAGFTGLAHPLAR